MLNQNGSTDLWIWAMDDRSTSYGDTKNYYRWLMVGYGEGPSLGYIPFFKKKISVTNETAESINYIGLLTYWNSFEYEILNGKNENKSFKKSCKMFSDGTKGKTDNTTKFTWIPNNGYIYDLFNKK